MGVGSGSEKGRAATPGGAGGAGALLEVRKGQGLWDVGREGERLWGPRVELPALERVGGGHDGRGGKAEGQSDAGRHHHVEGVLLTHRAKVRTSPQTSSKFKDEFFLD